MSEPIDPAYVHDIEAMLIALVRVVDVSTSPIKNGTVFARAKALAMRAKPGRRDVLPWTVFRPAGALPPTEEHIALLAKALAQPVEAIRAEFQRILTEEELLVNSRYQVNRRHFAEGWVHLSVKRLDQAPIHDWRDLMRIKDDLVGPECEAIEIYPAQSRLADSANQYHLWCSTDPTYRFPFGFQARMVNDIQVGPHGQRPFEDPSP